MHMRLAILAALFLLPAIASPADTIDDADAKRRGIPVAQVQVENALVREKQKTAALEKDVADLQRQLATLTAETTSASDRAGVAKPSGATLSPSAPSSIRGADPAPPWAELPFEGPHARSEKYRTFVNRYLKGDWATLAADLTAADKEIAAMPEGDRADLKYIQLTLAECGPEWWGKVRGGTAFQFRQSMFGEEAIVDYEPGAKLAAGSVTNKGNLSSMHVQWSVAEMDSQDPPPVGFSLQNVVVKNGGYEEFRNNFVEADVFNNLLWRLLGSAAVSENTAATGKTPGDADTVKFKRYTDFIGEMAAAYYGTPAGRRLAIVHSSASLDRETLARLPFSAFRPLSAALLADLKIHPSFYATLGIGSTATNFSLTKLGKNGEYDGAKFMISGRITDDYLDLKDERRVREIAKRIADENQDWKTSSIKLPEGLLVDLDPAKDDAYFRARLDFLRAVPQ